MAETMLLVPDFDYAYSTLLAARLGVALEREGARTIVAVSSPVTLPVASEIVSDVRVASLARLASRCSASRVIWLGPPHPGLVMLRRHVVVIGLATRRADDALARCRRRLGHRVASRRMFAGWVSLVTDPGERVFVREHCEIHEPISASSLADRQCARSVIAYAEDAAGAHAIATQLQLRGIRASEVAFAGHVPDAPAFERVPVTAVARGASQLFAPPQLELVLDAHAAGVAVTMVAPPGDAAGARRVAYLTRRLARPDHQRADSAPLVAQSILARGGERQQERS